MSSDPYSHTRDEYFREMVGKAIRQLEASLSETAIDHYAAEKLHNAVELIGVAQDHLKHLSGKAEAS